MSTYSILIANYNNAHFLKECIDSVLAQTYQDYEVIILDDCSTDNSIEIIESLIKGNDQFRLVTTQANRGVAPVKYDLVSLAKGDFFAFLDPDDYLEPNALQASIDILNRDTNVVLTYSNHYRFQDGNYANRYYDKKIQIEQDDSTIFFNKQYKNQPFHFVTYRMSAYQKTEGINKFLVIGEDWDLIAKMEEVGKLYHIDLPLYNYRIHSSNLSLGINNEKSQMWILGAIYEACKRRGDKNYHVYAKNYMDIHNPPENKKFEIVGKLICRPKFLFEILKSKLSKR